MICPSFIALSLAPRHSKFVVLRKAVNHEQWKQQSNKSGMKLPPLMLMKTQWRRGSIVFKGGQKSEFSDKETFFPQSLIGNITDCNGPISLNCPVVTSKCQNSENSIKVQSNPFLDEIRVGSEAKARQKQRGENRGSGSLPQGKCFMTVPVD